MKRRGEVQNFVGIHPSDPDDDLKQGKSRIFKSSQN